MLYCASCRYNPTHTGSWYKIVNNICPNQSKSHIQNQSCHLVSYYSDEIQTDRLDLVVPITTHSLNGSTLSAVLQVSFEPANNQQNKPATLFLHMN